MTTTDIKAIIETLKTVRKITNRLEDMGIDYTIHNENDTVVVWHDGEFIIHLATGAKAMSMDVYLSHSHQGLINSTTWDAGSVDELFSYYSIDTFDGLLQDVLNSFSLVVTGRPIDIF